MNETPHTPGPWGFMESDPRHVRLKRKHWRVGGGPESKGVAFVFGANDANARLIAAAPDLLDFVKTLENDDNKIPAWLWDKRNELIAKAEGREQ